MKPILVPVDFSKPAENAARYAVHLAKMIQSDICLCHSFLVPADAVGSGQIAWPLYEYSTLEQICKDQLEREAKKLQIEDKTLSSPSSFHPVISCSAIAGTTQNVLGMLVHEKKAGLIIMGMSGAGAVSRFFMGSVSRQTVEHADVPVLLIPRNVRFNGIKKIALATDLNESDVEVIHSLASLAAQFAADLVVTHITDEFYDTPEHHKKSESFLREVTNKINYDRIYYRHVLNTDVDQGLDWLTENGKIDMLAMVHQQKGALARIFSSSHTKKLADHVSLPLLVFPSGKHFTF